MSQHPGQHNADTIFIFWMFPTCIEQGGGGDHGVRGDNATGEDSTDKLDFEASKISFLNSRAEPPPSTWADIYCPIARLNKHKSRLINYRTIRNVAIVTAEQCQYEFPNKKLFLIFPPLKRICGINTSNKKFFFGHCQNHLSYMVDLVLTPHNQHWGPLDPRRLLATIGDHWLKCPKMVILGGNGQSTERSIIEY